MQSKLSKSQTVGLNDDNIERLSFILQLSNFEFYHIHGHPYLWQRFVWTGDRTHRLVLSLISSLTWLMTSGRKCQRTRSCVICRDSRPWLPSSVCPLAMVMERSGISPLLLAYRQPFWQLCHTASNEIFSCMLYGAFTGNEPCVNSGSTCTLMTKFFFLENEFTALDILFVDSCIFL